MFMIETICTQEIKKTCVCQFTCVMSSMALRGQVAQLIETWAEVAKKRKCCANTRNQKGKDIEIMDQFRYIKIQSQTIDLTTRLRGIKSTNSVFIPQSLVLRSIVWGWILTYQNWSIVRLFSSLNWISKRRLPSQATCHLKLKATRLRWPDVARSQPWILWHGHTCMESRYEK